MDNLKKKGTSGPAGGIGKHVSPPHATTERIITRPQNNTQNCQEIELYGKSNNEGFKEATFIQVGRRGGDAEAGRGVQRHRVARRSSSGTDDLTFTCGR